MRRWVMFRKRRAKRPCKRSRSVIVAFRMEEDSATRLDALVSLSGLTKQNYIERRLLDESVTVIPSSRTAKSPSQWMQAIYRELVLARQEERMLGEDLAWIARAVAEEYGALSSESAVRDANEAMRDIPRR